MDSVSRSGSFAAVAATLLLAGYFYFRNAFSYWRRRGVRGPKPMPVVGNAKALLVDGREKIEEQWVQQYGKVYGIYYGTSPRLVVADLEVVQQICIKDFERFTDHDSTEFFNKYNKAFLLFLKGDHWKRVRAFMSPTFTSGKIKRMFKFLDLCAEDLVEYVREELSNNSAVVLDGKELYNLFTMDAIVTCCYSLKLERAQAGSDLKAAASRNELIKTSMSLFKFSFMRIVAVSTLPKFFLRLIKFELSPEARLMPLINIVQRMIDKRRENFDKKTYDDYLQMLIDARLEDKIEHDEMDALENHHANLSAELIQTNQEKFVAQVKSAAADRKRAPMELSDLEIITNASFLLLVGLETTGNLLCSCSFLLAHHPEVQERLYGELREIAQVKPAEKSSDTKRAANYSFAYEQLTSCKYLDAVISETLRTHSAAITGDRYTSDDYYIEKYDLTVERGTVIHIPFHAIMNDPDNFEDPHKFDPERFMPGQREKIKPGSYCPFGLGPRHCIGMRFSLTEAKLALAKILMSFRLEPAPGTKFPPDSLLVTGLVRCIKDPRVRFVPREV